MVPVVDLSRRGQRFAEAFGAAAQRIAAGGQFLLGPELTAFERELASSLGAPHCAAVASGAGALQLALTAIGVGAGHEVIVPAHTAVPTAAAVCAVGARPVFADVDPATACMTTEIDGLVTDRTAAVIVVHLYGYPAPLPPTDIPVVEDAAQAQGAIRDPARSAATAYSFYPTKNLGGIGDGGAVVTTDGMIDGLVRRLRVHGMTEQYVHEHVSQNFRMSELEAAWLRIALPTMAADVDRRRQIAAHFRSVAPQLRWQAAHPDHTYHLCVFRAAEREATRAALAEAGVGTAVHYPLALTQQPAYRPMATRPCPQAEAWAAECISVPCFPEMTDAEVEIVGAALARVAG